MQAVPILTSKLGVLKPGKATDAERRAIADRFTGFRCTLDGKPAIVCGRLNRFATIATLDGALSVEFCWETVNRVMYGTMEFKGGAA